MDEETKNEFKETIIKALPWVIGIGVVVYFKGYRAGYKRAIKEAADVFIVKVAL